jgi:hypothetical protein
VKINYTQIVFGSPESKVAYCEAALETKAERVAELWKNGNGRDGLIDLLNAVDDLANEVRWLAEARAERDDAEGRVRV